MKFEVFDFVAESDEHYSLARIARSEAINNPSLKATNKISMPQSLFKMLVHIVFSTKNRVDLIAPEIENDLYAYIHGIAENNGAKLIGGGGTANHIHLLVSLPKKIDVPVLIGDIKRDSSVWVKEQNTKYADFYWQKGYGAFSIGQTQVGKISNYIKTQKEHHRKHTYKNEFRTWLNKYEIEFDEQYVWD